jgi:polyhydroxyalkanoate synthase
MKSSAKTQPETTDNPYDLDRLAHTWGEMVRLGADIWATVAKKSEHKAQTAVWTPAMLDPFNLQGAWMGMLDHMLSQPEQLTQAQFDLWRKYLDLWNASLTRMSGGQATDIVEDDPSDKRFKGEAWHRDAVFAFIRQSYLLSARWLMQLVEQNSQALDEDAAKKLKFFTKAYVDALSPANFAFTNPEVIKATIDTGGENLMHGMKNLLEDLKRGSLRMTDESAFKIGENIATTPGQVVFRNHLFELIHYAPAGDKTFETPLLDIPPWINKYYILDLKPENSFIRWALAQGHAVFVVSWVNPGADMKETDFDDYMTQGMLQALFAVEKQTGAKTANVVGYCIGGTLLAMTLAWLKAANEDKRIASATFLTTLLDFHDSGDLKLFVDEEQLASMRDHMENLGFMDANSLKSTFNLLRANDLIWSFVVNNYLMGREPFPFDLLYWNSDSTNLPAAMHEYYLRHMYLQNDLVKPGALDFAGVKLDLRTIDTPAYFLSTHEDHIAPWKATFAGAKLFSGDVTFTLSASGHIAGVVNPPAKNKYCYWTGAKKLQNADAWMDGAKQHEGSWWTHWQQWIEKFAGKKIPALDPKSGPLAPLCPAPGEYVTKKA